MKRICFFLFFIVGCDTHDLKNDWPLEYSLFSEGVLHLEFRYDPSDTLNVSAFAQTNIPRDGSESNGATVNKADDYYLNIEIDRPTQCFLNLAKEQFNIFVFPHDTTHIILSDLNGVAEIGFSGELSPINNYYLNKKESLGYTDIRFPLNKPLSQKSNYKRIKQTTDSIINRELAFFEGYISKHDLPKWFKHYEQSEMKYTGAVYKTIMPHANEIMKYFEDTVPADYYDYLPEIQINNQNALFSSAYFSFLDAYFLRELPVSKTNDLSGFKLIAKMESHKLNQSKHELSDQIKNLYQTSNFSSLIKYYSDSLAIDSLARAFEVSNYRQLVKVAGIRSRNEMQSFNLHRGDTIPDFILATTVDSLISIRDFSQQHLYVNFWATWCGPCLQNIPDLNKLIAHYQNDPRVGFLNICLDSEHDKWLATIEKYKIRGVNLLAEGNWNSKLRAYFNIKGIPHYAILSKHNILLENATEKAPAVREKIESTLNGGTAQQSSYPQSK